MTTTEDTEDTELNRCRGKNAGTQEPQETQKRTGKSMQNEKCKIQNFLTSGKIKLNHRKHKKRRK